MKKILLASSFLLTATFNTFAHVPDDEFDRMNGLSQINAGAAYDFGFTGKGITIGVVDSGIDKTHFEFYGKVSPYSYHYVYEKDIFDQDGHGTHVSGTIAAARNGKEMHGVAYDANLSVFGIMDLNGEGVSDRNNEERSYAFINTRPELKIINNSYGVNYSLYGGSIREEIDEYDADIYEAFYGNNEFSHRKASLTQYDKVMVMAAGNEKDFQPSVSSAIPYYLPETLGNVVVVVAYNSRTVDYNDKTTFADDEVLSDPYSQGFSNLCGEARAYCIAAPGVDIYSTFPEGGYESFSGTSMATPFVSGALGLISEAFPGMTGEQLLSSMFENAIKASDIGKNSFTVDRYETIGLEENEDEKYVSARVFRENEVVSFENAVGQGFLDVGEAVKGPRVFSDNYRGVYSYNSPINTLSIFRHDITGSDGYEQTGLGNVLFAGNNNYVGMTTVNGGGLYLENKSLSSGGVIVKDKAFFGGSGAVNGGVTVNPGGSIEVGRVGDYGSLSIDVLNSNKGNLIVNIKDHLSAKISTNTTEINEGYVSMTRGSNSEAMEYHIGNLSNLTGSGYLGYKPLYQFSQGTLRMDGDDLYLNLSKSMELDEIKLSSNQQKIADAYKELENDDSLLETTSKIYGLNPNNGEAQEALSELGGTLHANQMASKVTQKTSTNIFSRLNRIGNPMMSGAFDEVNSFQVAQAYGDSVYFPSYTPLIKGSQRGGYRGNGSGIWAQPFAGYTDVKKDEKNNLPSLDTSIFGVQAGADTYIRNNWVIGGTLSYGQGQTKQKGSRIDVDDYRIGVYTGAEVKDFDLKGVLTSGYQRYDSKRGLGPYGLNAKGDYEGYNFDLALDGAYNFYKSTGNTKLRLVFGIDAMYSRINSFTEEGAGIFNLSVDGISDTMVDGKLGLGFSKQGSTYGFSADLYYKRLFTGYDNDMTARFEIGNTKFKLDGYDYDKNMGGIEVSYYYNVTSNAMVYLDVIGEFSSDINSVAGTAGVRYSF